MKECHIKIFNTVLETLLENNNKLLINDRLGKNNNFKKNILVFEDRYFPVSGEKLKLENNQIYQHVNTIGLSWGRNKEQKEEDYKSGEDLYQLYKKVRKLHGSLCLNLGPNSDGSFDKNEVNSLLNFCSLRK